MPQVKYTRLPQGEWSPAKDSVAFDFNSVAFDFNSVFSYKSVYTYSKLAPPFIHEEKEYKPPFVTRLCSLIVTVLSYLLLVVTFPVSGWFAIKMVPQFERIVVFRLGRLQSTKGPGCILINPFIDRWRRVDMRTRAFNVPPQQILTSDGAAISLGATVYHRIADVVLSIAGIQDMNHSIRNLGQTVLLNLISARELSTVERDKALVNATMQEIMNGVTQNWGVEVSRAEISEITVIQEASTSHVGFQKITNLFTQVTGQMAAGHNISPQLPPGLSSPLSIATTSQEMSPPSPAPSSQDHSSNQQQPTGPPSAPVASTLVDLSSPSALNAEELLALALPVLDQDLVREIGAIFKFTVIGDGGGTYYLDLKTGQGHAAAGEPPVPADVVLTITMADMRAMFEGQLRPGVAYMSGRLRVDGDRTLALSLERVISRIREAQS